MSSAVSGLIGANGQRLEYRAQAQVSHNKAELTRAVGAVKKTKAYADATATEEQSKKNSALAGQQMRGMRKAQSRAAASAETAQAASGFDISSGSGKAAREQAIEQFDSQIANMAQSNSISTTNSLQRAIDFRRQGDMEQRMADIEAIGYDAEGMQYKYMEKKTNRGMVAGGIGAAVGATVGMFVGGPMMAEQLGNLGWNLGAGSNPYTAGFTSGNGVGDIMGAFSGMFGGGGSGMMGGSSGNMGGVGGGMYSPTYNGQWMDSGGFVGFGRT